MPKSHNKAQPVEHLATESLHKFAQEAVAKHTKTLSTTFGDDVESVECFYLGVSNGGADGEFDAGALAAPGSLLCYRWKLRLKDGNDEEHTVSVQCKKGSVPPPKRFTSPVVFHKAAANAAKSNRATLAKKLNLEPCQLSVGCKHLEVKLPSGRFDGEKPALPL